MLGEANVRVAAARDLIERERSKVGDRLVAFSVLLPARVDGPVVIAVDESLSPYLATRYPHAIVLTLASPGPVLRTMSHDIVVWDGVHSPLAIGTAALLIADARSASVQALRPAVAPDGICAVIGTSGEWLIYPSLERPEQLWRRGWPRPDMPTLRAHLRRRVGLRASRLRGAVRLSVIGPPAHTLAEDILGDIQSCTGRSLRLVGVETAGQTILRVRGTSDELAVRVSLSGLAPQDPSRQVAGEIAGTRHLILDEHATGTTAGYDWVLTDWLPQRRRPASEYWRGNRRRWAVAEELSAALTRTATGVTGPGWAERWCADLVMLSERERERLTCAAAVLDRRIPTGWCHGDLWPANIVLDRTRAGVIDWVNAVADAPLGLDWLLVAAHRAVSEGTASMAEACVRLIDGSLGVHGEVGGRRFTDWGPSERIALVVAAFVHYLRNRSMHDIGVNRLTSELEVVFAALPVAPVESEPAAAAVATQPNVGRAARGALWLGLSALVVKGGQTIVLLIVAALLAPSALGLLALGAVITNVAQTVSDLGVSTGLVYWRGDPNRAARTALTLSVASSSIIVGAVWGAAPWLGHALHQGTDATWVIRGLIIVLPLYGIASVSQELLRRELSFVRRILPDVVASMLGAVVAVVLVLNGDGLAGIVAGQIVQAVVTLLLTWVVGQVVRPGWIRSDMRALLRYGGQLTAAGLVGLVLLNVDYVMVSRVLGNTALGQYSLAFRLAYLPFLNIAYVIAGAAFPYLCRLSEGAAGRAVTSVVGAAMTLLVPTCLGLALFAHQLELLGDKWDPAVAAVPWLALYALLLSLAQFMYTALNSIGRPRSSTQLRILHLLTLVCLLAVVVRHGVHAVAVSQAIAAAVAAVAAVGLARVHVDGFRLARLAKATLPCCVGGAAMVLVAISLHHRFPGTSVSAQGLLVVGSLSLAAYALPVLFLGRADMLRTARMIRSRT